MKFKIKLTDSYTIWMLIGTLLVALFALGFIKLCIQFILVLVIVLELVARRDKEEPNVFKNAQRDFRYGMAIGLLYVVALYLIMNTQGILTLYDGKRDQGILTFFYLVSPFFLVLLSFVFIYDRKIDEKTVIPSHLTTRKNSIFLSLSASLSMVTIVGIILLIASGLTYIIKKDDVKIRRFAKDAFFGSLIGLAAGFIAKYVMLYKLCGANKIIWYL